MPEETYTLSAEAAEFYESTFVPALFADWAARIVDAAGVAPGESVLDVACGTGAVARAAAGRLGLSGPVNGRSGPVGVDGVSGPVNSPSSPVGVSVVSGPVDSPSSPVGVSVVSGPVDSPSSPVGGGSGSVGVSVVSGPVGVRAGVGSVGVGGGSGPGGVGGPSGPGDGSAGFVVGLDANEAMLAVARRLRPDLWWQLGQAEALPFGDGSFDVVLSQAALMFFDDRVAALREMGRVAGAAGRVAVQVPGRLAGSPGYLALTQSVARYAEPNAAGLLDAYFDVGDPDLLAAMFAAAGLHIDRFETWLGATRLDSIDTFLAVELLPLADRVDQAVRGKIIADCHTTLAPFTDPTGAIAAPIEVHLITAHA